METTAVIPPVDIGQEVHREIAELKNGTILVQNSDDLAFAGVILQKIKAMRTWISTKFDPIIAAAHATHKAACAQKNEMDIPLAAKEAEYKRAVETYYVESKRKMEEEQNRLQMEATHMAEDEHKRQLKELTKSGLKAEARALKQAGPTPLPVVLATQTPSMDGMSVRNVWTWEVTDINLIPPSFLIKTVNKGMVDALARAQKGKASVPGIRFFEKSSVAVRKPGV